MSKHRLTPQELQEHLNRQIAFLEVSSDAYDRGFEDEAFRLAVTLRLLLHDTKHSFSLLGQLGKKGGMFVDTALPFNPANLCTHHGLVAVKLGSPATYTAWLDGAPVANQVSFDNWWNTPVFADLKRRQLTRKQLVLTAADQDGGAHVDPALDEDYAKLVKSNSLNWFSMGAGEVQPAAGPERASLRQIAHEMLKTLKPGYSKRPDCC